MRKLLVFIFVSLVSITTYVSLDANKSGNPDKKTIPSDWFWQQRAYPEETVRYEEYFKAMEEKKHIAAKTNKTSDVKWVSKGPSNIGGRVVALEWNPVNKDIIYAGAAAGGIFKTTDAGETWHPKTDHFPSLSVGALEMDPNNPDILYCGTGEANNSGDSYPGFGVIKSTDAGETWELIGLEDTRHIGAVKVHPLNTDIVYVAAAGGLYSKSNHRGVYKSVDGGLHWEQVFFLNDSTSAIDLELDPTDTNVVYVSMMERMRSPTRRKAAGIHSGVYKSTDAGGHWERLGNGLPEPNEQVGRIALAVAPSDPNYVYALVRIATDPNGDDSYIEGLYKSTDKGENWQRYADAELVGNSGGFSWYFGLCEVDPGDPETLYIGDLDLLRSTNGGESWKNKTDVYPFWLRDGHQHPDQHALVFDSENPATIISGNDGGIFISTNSGDEWLKLYDLPISQFYAMTVDFQLPHRIYGGTQDNCSMRTEDGEADQWEILWGGDGFHCAVDYTDSDIFYVESQWGRIVRTTNGGRTFASIMSGIDNDRTNWSTPYMIDPIEPSVLYYGSYKLHITTDKGDNWEIISEDLTKGENGRMGTITAISAAVHPENDERIIIVGSDDGTLSVTTNTGESWINRSEGLPERYITDVLVDRINPNIAYATLSGYNIDNSAPHVFKTTNLGENWVDISSNLPDIPVNSIVIDYTKDSTLYIGTDAGVFYTQNYGEQWQLFGEGLPNAPVTDIVFHEPTQMLYAATHGRSIFAIDASVLSDIEDASVHNPVNFTLHQNYPNPFNPATTIEYVLKQGTKVLLKVYDIKGALITTLVNGVQSAGKHRVNFDAALLPSGVYFYRLEANEKSETKKMIVVK